MNTLLFVVTEDWYFWSHRIDLACAARDAGYRVVLAARFGAHRARIEARGIECIDLPFERSLRHPLRDLYLLFALNGLIGRERPALVHLVALKPILLSSLAVCLRRTPRYILALTGMGYLFSSRDGLAQGIRRLVRPLLRFLLSQTHAHAIVQNDDDLALLGALGVAPSKASLIRGAGVDLARYVPQPPVADDAPVIVLPARMLRDKGVAEFLAAAPLVRAAHPAARLVLAGGIDADNPAAYSRAELSADAGIAGVEWWGHCEDMREVYAAASIVCLPSYREGLPKALLEAAACARPLIAADVPGCRDICRDGISGVLVPAREAPALATAINGLLADPVRRARLADGARRLVEREFSSARVHADTLELYARLLAPAVA